MAPHGVLLVSCPDRRGIIAAVAGFVTGHGGNVIDLQQHVDAADQLFFQRVEFELDGMDLDRRGLAAAFADVADRFDMTWSLRFTDDVMRLAVLASRTPHCLNDLLNRWHSGELPVDIVVVIANHGEHAETAARFGVEFHHVVSDPDDRRASERTITEICRSSQVDLLVLARYMQILTSEFCAEWPERIINIHHSFLPAFVGAKPYHQAHERGVKVIGVTAHYVTEELDDGPIIAQDVAAVSHRDDVDSLRRRGRDLEVTVLARAVRAHIEHRVLVCGRRTVVFD